MSFHRGEGPADRAETDRLLDAARAGRPPGPDADPLARLLAAAAAPAEPGELGGEEQALAAFRAARAEPAPAPARASRRRLRLGAAAWAAGLAATATAGVAFAAVRLDRAPAPVPAPSTASTGGPVGPTRSGSADPTAGSPAPTPASAAPTATGLPGRPARTPQLTGLCRAYLAKSAGQRAEALETPAFGTLVVAAGGADQVTAYCTRLVPAPGPKASPKPDPKASPKSEPKASPGAPGRRSTEPGGGPAADTAANGAGRR
ncbi:hypothetical protein [Micromonospora sp. NPDC050495]|uniref:hypothetical protein n=1 Tax=Micromonospora sp. NPDC050495 TaxID=3154936 RepID=UPI0033F24CFF